MEAQCGATDQPGVCMPLAETPFCTTDYAPVCGCDNITYNNECLAHLAGTSIASLGPCFDDPPPMCESDRDFDRICDSEDLICNLDSIPINCRRLQPDCPDGQVPELIDGCYTDACVTWDMCQPIILPDSCGTLGAPDCPRGTFCHLPIEAMCGANEMPGVCLPIEQVACTDDYTPVCGCDGQTYSNECYAMLAGVSIGSFGECEDDPMCIRDSDLDGICDQRDQTCNRDDSAIICTVLPPLCPPEQVVEVINGCYGECITWAECIGGDTPGIGELCGSRGLAECPANTFCDYSPRAMCGATDIPGTCQPIGSEVCLDIYDPVCGCNGQTYDNQCQARSEGVSVRQVGACGQLRCGGIAGLACPNGEACLDDPSDDCDPNNGGTDCIGICAAF